MIEQLSRKVKHRIDRCKEGQLEDQHIGAGFKEGGPQLGRDKELRKPKWGMERTKASS